MGAGVIVNKTVSVPKSYIATNGRGENRHRIDAVT